MKYGQQRYYDKIYKQRSVISHIIVSITNAFVPYLAAAKEGSETLAELM
jgi:hypothetical protein